MREHIWELRIAAISWLGANPDHWNAPAVLNAITWATEYLWPDRAKASVEVTPK